MRRSLLFAVLVLVIFVGYPVLVGPQGKDASYTRLAVKEDVRIAGALTFGTALTSAMTAKLGASGIASIATYLRGDGTWAGVSPKTYWDIKIFDTTLTTTSTSFIDTGLSLSVVATATDTVVLGLSLQYINSRCLVRFSGGTSALQGYELKVENPTSEPFLVTMVDSPGAGTHVYKVQVAKGGSNAFTCQVQRFATFLAQVLK